MISKLTYTECTKGGLHNGELVNFACIEKACFKDRNSIGCSVCMESDHENCRKSPLKFLFKQLSDLVGSHKNLGRSSCSGKSQSSPRNSANESSIESQNLANELNPENNYEQLQQNLLNLILSSRQQILEDVVQSTNGIIDKLRNIQQLSIRIFDNVEKQAREKFTKENEIEGLVDRIMYSTNTVASLQDLLGQIFNIIPADYIQFVQNSSASTNSTTASQSSTSITGKPDSSKAGQSLNTSTSSQNNISSSNALLEKSNTDLQNLHENLSALFTSFSQNISQKNNLILGLVNLQEKFLLDLREDEELVGNLSGKKKLDLTFSATEKHSSISIIKPNIVKSNAGSSSNYKFVLTNSSLPMNSTTKFAFKLQNITSQNWIAIGVALKKVIKAKNYSFSLSLGHGAYMISSNSGSWSHSEAENNNVVKSFDFSNNSIVECTFDPIEGQVIFQIKDNPTKKYKLLIDKQKFGEDTYHPCVLFYYPNDEVELIYPYA